VGVEEAAPPGAVRDSGGREGASLSRSTVIGASTIVVLTACFPPAHAIICYAAWRNRKANAHVNEEHVVEPPPTVMVIDDDPGVRDSLGKLLRSAGFRVSLCGSVSEFLAADRSEGPTCLVLDVRLPGQSGLELQRELVPGIIAE
jgi:PleD family two-component response regulator